MTESIYTAINAVMGQVGYVKKQRSPNLNYTYAGEAALIAALRPEMVEQGIVVNVEEIRDVATREYQSSRGASMTNVTLTAVFRLTHAPSGTHILATARGEGSDSGDKANNKAMTCAYKYMLRQTFVIETGDDPDRFQPQPRADEPEQSEPKAPRTNGKPQAEPDGDNEPADDKFKGVVMYRELFKQARELGLKPAVITPGKTTKGELRKLYAELKAEVEMAQAKPQA